MEGSEDFARIREENELARRALVDEGAFVLLYERYLPRIFSFIYKRIGEKAAVEDIVSATFEKVFIHLKDFRSEKGNFQSWIYRIAANETVDFVRSRRRVVVVEPEFYPEISGINPQEFNDFIAVDKARRSVQKILELLPARYQEVLLLKFYSELSNQEIADALKISINNATVLIHRACQKFHTLYEEYEQI